MAKKMLIVVSMLVMVLFASNSFACWSSWDTFKGMSEQNNGSYLDLGNVDVKRNGDIEIINGVAISGFNQSKASYFGKTQTWGIGGSLAIGGTALWTGRLDDGYWAAGLTGNMAGAGLLGGHTTHGNLKINGNGEFGVGGYMGRGDNFAFGNANGKFSYKATSHPYKMGALLGGGLTGGGIRLTLNSNHASVVTGNVSVSGVGQIPSQVRNFSGCLD